MIGFIHYGNERFDISKFQKVSNREFVNKPNGGFWASPINTENSWKNLCIKERCFTDSLKKHFIFNIKPGAKILNIKTKEDLNNLSFIYKRENCFGETLLNFDTIAECYDALYVEIEELYWEMYSWDCDTLLVFNPDIIIR